MSDVRVEWLKWPSSPHRLTPMTRLGEDRHGEWLFAPRGTPATHDGVGVEPLPANFITLLPSGRQWWVATWMSGNPDIDIALYVDIVQPPEWVSDSHLRIVDLDLDVIRFGDGRTVVDDEDEFATNSVSRAYPRDVIAAATETAARVGSEVSAQAPPFTASPARAWLSLT